MVGIKRLAEHLDISIGTVSRALNGRPDVNDETRKRVLEAAAEFGYVANQSGRNLRQGNTNAIGFMIESGVDTAGKGETVNLLNEWMDPRWIVTRGYTDPSSEELERPRLWRYWRDLPPHGRIALFLSAWYSSPVRHRVAGRSSTSEFDALLTADQNIQFQQNLKTLPLAVVVLVADSNRLESLEPLVPRVLQTLTTLEAKTLVRVGAQP